MSFFKIFFVVAHLPIETKLFCYYQNFISSAVQKNHGGDKKNVNFRLKMTPQAKKMTFFGIFFFCCTSSRRDETFLLLPKFHIFSCSEKSWGDQKKRYIEQQRTNDERTMNDERRRTTWTIIRPRQDSQNTRANNRFD